MGWSLNLTIGGAAGGCQDCPPSPGREKIPDLRRWRARPERALEAWASHAARSDRPATDPARSALGLVDPHQVPVGVARHHRAAGQEEDGAGYPLGLVRREVDARARDVLGMADPAKGIEGRTLPAIRL